MFEHTESWEFASPSAETLADESRKYWEFAGFEVDAVAPRGFEARCWSGVFGIVRSLDLAVTPIGSGGIVHLRYRVRTAEGSVPAPRPVAGVPAPRPPGGPKTPWEICEEDWDRDRLAFWQFLVDTLGARPLGVADTTARSETLVHAPPTHGPAPTPPAWAPPVFGGPARSASPPPDP